MAGPNGTREAPPALVNNVETLANVTWVLAKGPAWFRHVGTTDSPGTMICTVTGSTRRNGVAEIPLGSSLRDVLEHVGGGARPGRRTRGVLPGVANALVTDDLLDTPVSYEAFTSIGSGLGSAGFIVFDDHDDVVALVAGASHFLSVESCGQCTPCKTSGLRIADLLAKLSRNTINDAEFEKLRTRVVTVADSARCGLAGQQQNVVGSLLTRCAADVEAHRARRAAPAEPVLVAELVDLRDGVAVVDERHASKQPDWSYDAIPSGKPPAARFGEHRDPQVLER
jgi:NADH:ubiquinone oxidoreductase subunit F (NADH-binding)